MVDALARSDLASVELQERFDISSNLLAHHLDVLERAGLIVRSRSSGDGRRRYVHLLDGRVRRDRVAKCIRTPVLSSSCAPRTRRAVSSRPHCGHQLTRHNGRVGGNPSRLDNRTGCAHRREAGRVGSRRCAARDRCRRCGACPHASITVCDQAHEELEPGPDWLHWSIVDPVPLRSKSAFDATVVELRRPDRRASPRGCEWRRERRSRPPSRDWNGMAGRRSHPSARGRGARHRLVDRRGRRVGNHGESPLARRHRHPIARERRGNRRCPHRTDLDLQRGLRRALQSCGHVGRPRVRHDDEHRRQGSTSRRRSWGRAWARCSPT